MNRRHLVLSLALAAVLAGCGVTVRSDRAAVGGGPAQATAQSQQRTIATVSAVATANPSLGSSTSCDCESGK